MIIVIFGPSGSGKNKVAKIMEERFQSKKFVTDTTRPIRKGEVDGIDYNFLDIDSFMKNIKEDKYLEYVMYANNFYGSKKEDYQKFIDNNENTIIVMDIRGVKALKEYFSNNVLAIFLNVSKETLIKRMKIRGETDELIQERLKYLEETREDENIKFADFVLDNNGTVEELKAQVNELMKEFEKK